MIEMKAVKSSFIKSAGYDAESRELHVLFFNGKTFAYRDVPAEVYERMVTAKSVGRFYVTNIKTIYSCREE